jgi:nicotinate-nucleotide pyrophosphorylase (carboxylating)
MRDHVEDCEPPIPAVREAVARALAEDLLPLGDLTAGLLDPGRTGAAAVVSRGAGVFAGGRCLLEVCQTLDPEIRVDLRCRDGEAVRPATEIARLDGPLRSILTAERTALNFCCHLSGIASLTARFVEVAAAVDPAVVIWDTRKTTPGLRSLEKAAVRAGGGRNHRGNLSEAVLVKDNHLGALGISVAVARARERWPGRMIEVECDHLDQVPIALEAGATLVMFDNMTPAEVRAGVLAARAHPRRAEVLLEVSGGVTLDNLADYVAAGPDVISVGAITHSASILDLGLDLLSG